MGKFIFRTFSIAALALLGCTLYQATVAGHPSNLSGGASAGGGFIQSAMNAVGPASDRTLSETSANLQFCIGSGELFLRRNGARARLELQSMARSLPSSLSGLMPRSGSSLLQSTAAAVGNNPAAVAKKIPVVNGALNATKQRIAAVGQSIGGAASGF